MAQYLNISTRHCVAIPSKNCEKADAPNLIIFNFYGDESAHIWYLDNLPAKYRSSLPDIMHS